jgi:hypothetical protein
MRHTSRNNHGIARIHHRTLSAGDGITQPFTERYFLGVFKGLAVIQPTSPSWIMTSSFQSIPAEKRVRIEQEIDLSFVSSRWSAQD